MDALISDLDFHAAFLAIPETKTGFEDHFLFEVKALQLFFEGLYHPARIVEMAAAADTDANSIDFINSLYRHPS